MMNPIHALQSTQLKQMTNGRATWDNHREFNGVFTMGQNSLLYNSLGFFASRDNVYSSNDTTNQTGCIDGGEACMQHNAALNNAVAVLTSGPYGISDGVGFTDRVLVMRSCRSDGVMLRPLWPLSSLDAAFTRLAGALVWAAHDEPASGYRWSYVLGVNLASNESLFPGDLQPRNNSTMACWRVLSDTNQIGSLRLFDTENPLVLHTPTLPKDPLEGVDPGSVHWGETPM